MSLAGSRNHSTTPITLFQNDCITGQCSELQLFNDCHSGAIHNYVDMDAELGSFNSGRSAAVERLIIIHVIQVSFNGRH